MIAVVFIVVAIVYLESVRPKKELENPASIIPVISKNATTSHKAMMFQRAKEIVNPSGFVNTDRILIQQLIDKKVIMVMFWTYSCINCQRELPYINAWYDKYHDKGLEIIGVHTPEFNFEKDRNNLLIAVKEFGVKFPVVQDNNYSTWSAYGNQYWPRKYLIDIDGFIVFDQIGEGRYDEMEHKVQSLLAERNARLGIKENVPAGMVNPKAIEADTSKRISPETYFGSSRNEYFGNGSAHTQGMQLLKLPSSFKDDTFYLDGSWQFSEEFAENKSVNAFVTYTYNAKNVYLVAGADKPVRIKIMLDGKPLGTDGYVIVKDAKLYKLIEGSNYGHHTIKLIIQDTGVRLFTFTFG